jgi:tetratricopeptide (TPR) repeat protein
LRLRALLTAGAAAAAVAASGCATLSGTRVERAQTGELVVRVAAPTTFDTLAESVYGDGSLGHTLAVVSHLPYDGGVPRGTVLVLPERGQLDARLQTARESDRLFEQGLAAADRGAFREAADRFEAALAETPQRIDVRYNLGLALMQSGELSRATQLLEQVAEARPDDAESRYAFGTVLRRHRAYVRAYQEFDAALRLDRRHAKAAFARARTLEDLQKWDRAERAWRSFLQEFADDPMADRARQALEAIPAEREDGSGAGAAREP